MYDVFVISYRVYDNGRTDSSPAAVRLSLEAACAWLLEEMGRQQIPGQYITGVGVNTRLVTEFSKTERTEYWIKKLSFND